MNAKKQGGKGPIKKLHRVPGSRLRKQSSASKVYPRHAVDHDNAWLKTKVRKINEALDRDPVDVDCLRKLALSEYGFVTDDIRCRVWPKLLNVNIFNLPKRSRADIEQKEFRKNKYFQQVKLDIDRSQRRFPSGTRASRRRVLQDQLTNIIMRTLCRNPELHYYQGYHDVAVTLLRVVGEDLAMALLEQLSLHHIRDFMDVNMERTNKMLALIHPILSKMDISLAAFIQSAEVGQIFALSWLITWFGHNLERFSVIVRLFDVFIATNPFMPIYVGAAIIESDVENVMELDCEMSTVHSYLSKLPNGLILEETEYIISKAYRTYLQYPPNILQRTAKYIVSQSSSASSHKQLVERSMMQKPDTLLRKRTRLRNFISDEPKQSAGFEEVLEKDGKGNQIVKLAVWTLSISIGAMTFLVLNAAKKWI
ncbi:TBC1 domain family member 20-like isoform X2 [Rhopilema esculentum]|uniref:TBC1 domain family member 20-like isoform X2 n=1 Tax=Rhopilema esculentum TaxID=499914 RepID=UPI0031E06E01